MTLPGFIIDTHLLRELGDLLVGRDSTAVLELIKNGYDADASVVRIDARQLSDPRLAVLTVEDDGNGMTLERFESAFLRIAGRDKETGARTSSRFARAYTGQKGIGRLASQKLARRLEVTSQPSEHSVPSGSRGVHARIDWDEIDQQDRLDQLEHGLEVTGVPIQPGLRSGTTLSLLELKRPWSRAEVAIFVGELQSAQPPSFLMGADAESLALAGDPLFGGPHIRNASRSDPGFSIQLAGDLDPGDDLWLIAADSFRWCVEIEVGAGRVRYRITPTQALADQEPLARSYDFETDTQPGLGFQARFYVMPNATSRGPLQGFTRAQSGIRVYLEGFRVLPYGEYGDDWLSIDRDYRRGARYYRIDLDEDFSDELEVDKLEGLNALAHSAYYGAVFLTNAGAPDLKSLVNREGFVPGEAFESIRTIVQNGVRLSVRVRRSLQNMRATPNDLIAPDAERGDPLPLRPTPSEARTESEDAPLGERPRPRASFDVLARRRPAVEAQRAMQAAAAALADRRPGGERSDDASNADVQVLAAGFAAAQGVLHDVQSIQAELRTLAGVGLQLGAFVHDINGMLASTTSIRELLHAVVVTSTDRAQRRDLNVILRSADELAHVLARQSSYLTDVLSTDPRRRRSRVPLRARCDSVLAFLAGRIAQRRIQLHIDVPVELKTPPMFPAEVTILLTNLLTNAVKNAAEEGNVWIDAREAAGGGVQVVITNDGIVVDLEESERWFLPFESTTTSIDEVLGQGLGLGLPIVRAMTDDYGGDVRFVPPVHASGSAVRVLLNRRDRS